MPYSPSRGPLEVTEGRCMPPFDLTEYPLQGPDDTRLEASIHSVFGYQVSRYAQTPWLKAYRGLESEPFMQCTGDTALMAARVVIERITGGVTA